MQLKHLQTVAEPAEGSQKVTAMAWSPNNAKLAVVTVERVVVLYDDKGEKRDRFATKPADKEGPKTYVVTGLAWSPDSTKLAVAQSDNIVFIYKLATDADSATEWDKKKAICNKFLQQNPVTCVTWPATQSNTVVYGLTDGKVRIGGLRSNKSSSLYNTHSMTIAVASNVDGTAIVSSHADGQIFRFDLEGSGRPIPVVKNTSPAYSLCWPFQSIFAAGPDKIYTFFDESGRVMQRFEHSEDEGEREPTAAVCSPSGQSIIVGGFNRLRVFDYRMQRNCWEESSTKDIQNLYTVTSLCWRPDGSKVAVGTLCGAVELFDCCLKRKIYNNKFEFVYVGPSQVIVSNLASGARTVLRSSYNGEIERISIMGGDRFVVASTAETLLLGDLQACKLTEIPWRFSGNEKYYFDNDSVCLIFNAGELSVVEYGSDDILGVVRTEHMNPHLLSVCVGQRRQHQGEARKLISFLVDPKTISIVDLATNNTLTTIEHDAVLDWLELNETGRKLLFRDRRHRLYLYDVDLDQKTSLLALCSYVQWVPGSDVVVAQSRNNLCIWYSIDHPEQMTTFPIKGEVTEIERSEGRTEVIVDEGVAEASYALDEGLIEFGTAVDDGDYYRAVAFLETLEEGPEAQAMWRTLGQLTLASEHLDIAEQCFAALGDISKASYLHDIVAKRNEEGQDSPTAAALVAALNGHFKLAETLYLEHGQTDEAIELYKTMHKWEDALAVAEAKNHPELELMRTEFETWLLETGQEEKAGEIHEKQGDLTTALQLYMKAGLPARAAQMLKNYPELAQQRDIVERVASALLNASLYDRAGELFEHVQLQQRALDAYRQGRELKKAVDLARDVFPDMVVTLEEEWGDDLVRQKRLDSAINHYIEAGCYDKAIKAAIGARQWAKAAQVVDLQDEDVGLPYYPILAKHYAETRQFQQAEKYFLLGRQARAAIDMYIQAAKWEDARRLAERHMAKEDIQDLYIAKAEGMARQKKYADAEKLFINIDEPDMAISMYKKVQRYDDMVRLVKKYHPDLLEQTHEHLAKELEAQDRLAQAEHHFVESANWQQAVIMYRDRDMWEEAHRVARQQGDQDSAAQIGYLWAKSLGGDSAVKLLTKFGIVDKAIDFACNQKEFDFAFHVARTAARHKLVDVHRKHAEQLEDEGKLKEAEQEFVQANCPREAVLMYVHAENWDSAQRVAEAHDPESLNDVLVGQARLAFENKEFSKAETYLLRAKKPELAVRCYRDAGMWPDAIRLAKEYLPSKLDELQREYARESSQAGQEAVYDQARTLERQGQHQSAIDAYLTLIDDGKTDHDFLEEAWERAAALAIKFTPDRAAETVTAICKKLAGLGRYEAAGDLLASIDMYPESIEACIRGEAWDKAREIAEENAPHLVDYVQEKYSEHLKQRHDPRLVDVDVVAGLDMLAKANEWEQCMTRASKEGGDVLNKYAALYATHLLREGSPAASLGVFVKYGAPASPNNFNLYRRIVMDNLAQPGDYNVKLLIKLRDVLSTISTGLQHANVSQEEKDEFDRLTKIVHFLVIHFACAQVESTKEMSAQLAMGLLHYTDVIPADRAFLMAGRACKELEWTAMAFVFLNHFLDLEDAIEEGELDGLSNDLLQATDIPVEVPLPETMCTSEEEREEIKEWVLAISLDDDVQAELRTDTRGCFEGCLSFQGDRKDECIVSGFPILDEAVDFSGGKTASKKRWNAFLMALRTSHNELMQDCLSFLGRWCNAPQNASYEF